MGAYVGKCVEVEVEVIGRCSTSKLSAIDSKKIRVHSTLTRKHKSFNASSPATNIFRTAKNDAIRTLSLDVDHNSSKTLRYARRCFLAPSIQGSNLVLSPTAVDNNPPASPDLSLVDEGPEGRDLIRWRRVEKWDRIMRFKFAFGFFCCWILLRFGSASHNKVSKEDKRKATRTRFGMVWD